MDKALSFGESLLVMLIGMTIVFLGLTVLILLIKLLVKATDRMGRKEKTPAAELAVAAAKPEAPAAEEEPAAEDDGAIVAAIMAAVSVVMGENSGFTVKRIRRVNNAPAWQRAGRTEQIANHF